MGTGYAKKKIKITKSTKERKRTQMGKAKQNAGSNISNLILPKSTDVMGTKK